MSTVRLSALVLSLLATTAAGQQPLSPAAFRSHVSTLAADVLAGRETGSAGGLAAAHYIAGVLSAAGCEPAGDDAGFLQDIGITGRSRTGPVTFELEAEDGTVIRPSHGSQWVLWRGWTEAADLAVLTVRSADELPAEPDAGTALVLAADPPQAFSWLGAERGAGWGAVVLVASGDPGEPSSPRAHLVGAAEDGLLLMLRGEPAFEASDGRWRRLRLAMPVGPPMAAYNVVGVLPGVGTEARPELADEVLVFTAHYDHIGFRDAAEGEDGIYNGADDDASGVAAVLELARVLGAGPPPARTLVFLLVTGEEHGLLGTYHYLDHPLRPLEATICNVNFEMVGRPDPALPGPGLLWLTGHSYSTLGPEWGERGLAVAPDPHPGQNFFRRSDNWAFVERGIVAQTLSSYGLHEDYHQVGDEADTLDYEHMATALTSVLSGLRPLVDGSFTPVWLPGAPAPGAPLIDEEG